MKTRLKHKNDKINSHKKNSVDELSFLSFNGEAVKYSEAKPSVALRPPEIFLISGKSPSVDATSINSRPAVKYLSEAKKTDHAEIVFKHYEKNSLSGERKFSRLEAIQRKILKHDFEKTKKENRLKELKKKNITNLVPLKPYYQIQTCDFNNSHFARVMVLCSCNDHVNCGVCRLKRMMRLQKRYLPALMKFKNAKMLTLTLKRRGENLKQDLDRLGDCLQRFKKTKNWKENVSSYFGSKEVVDGNVHAHIIISSRFWDQKDISKLWKEITGEDFIVDIRKLKNPEKAIKEVFKYIVKDTNKKTLKEVSDFRKANSHFRWVFSSKGLAVEVEEECEAFSESEILRVLEGEAEGSSSLDTIAISGGRGCPCCNGPLVLVGDFSSKEEAEAEKRRILAGNQYRYFKKT
jgi:hypothetical protein